MSLWITAQGPTAGLAAKKSSCVRLCRRARVRMPTCSLPHVFAGWARLPVGPAAASAAPETDAPCPPADTSTPPSDPSASDCASVLGFAAKRATRCKDCWSFSTARAEPSRSDLYFASGFALPRLTVISLDSASRFATSNESQWTLMTVLFALCCQ